MWPAPIWLSAGVALFAAYSIGRWSWPGIFLGAWLANLTLGASASSAALIAAGNTLGPLAAAELTRHRLAGESPFSRPRDVFQLGIAVVVNSGVAGVIGASVFWWGLKQPLHLLPPLWLEWFVADASAVVLLVPLLLLLRDSGASLKRIRRHAKEVLIICAVLYGMVTYLLKGDAGLPFLVLLPLLWVAMRFSAAIAYPAFVAVMTVVVIATLHGHGSYAGAARTQAFFVFAEMVAGFGAAVLWLGAASEEQRATEKALRKLNQELESRVEERTAELRESKERMEQAAMHDPLTGLPNRRYLEQRFGGCRSAAARKRNGLAVLLIDLDRFKQINDSIGHDAGDVILVETARRLNAAVREYDVVVRMGGDEFAVLLPDIEDPANVDSVCARIVKALGDRIFFNGQHIVTGASIGVALYPEHGDLWQEMYKAADTALYAAKRAGRSRWEWYRTEQAAATATK